MIFVHNHVAPSSGATTHGHDPQSDRNQGEGPSPGLFILPFILPCSALSENLLGDRIKSGDARGRTPCWGAWEGAYG